MNIKISDLTIDELKNLIRNIVHETMEDFLEDLKALSTIDYLNSIKESRVDYSVGDFKGYTEVF